MNNVITLEEDLTAIDLWQSIHGNANAWQELYKHGDEDNVCPAIDGSDQQFLSYLSKFPANRWIKICEGVGWTTYGAVALSWCEGASLDDVVEAWQKAMGKDNPEDDELRPARFINPDLLIHTKLSDVLLSGRDYNSAWLILAAHKAHDKTIEQDLDPKKFTALNAEIRKLL